MTIDDLKRALVQVREMCKKGKCVTCPLHKASEYSGIPYCPMYENGEGFYIRSPADWYIADWMEDTNETD